MNNFATATLSNKGFTKGSPVGALQHFCSNQTSGRLQVVWRDVTWIIRLENGKITYARHSVEPFDNLICHLRLMSFEVPSLTKEFRSRVSELFEDVSVAKQELLDTEEITYQCNEYEALCWLLNQGHLTPEQMKVMVQRMTKESLELLFWLDEVNYKFSDRLDIPQSLCHLELSALIAHTQQRYRLWQFLSPQVWSPYQRPYYFGQSKKQKELLPEMKLQEKFSTILKGFSFRQLAILMKQDELKIAGGLLPYMAEEVVVLRDPQAPFDKLPRVPAELPSVLVQAIATKSAPTTAPIGEKPEPVANLIKDIKVEETTYTIACVDDSPTVLTEIGRFLKDSNLKFFAINDSLKAPMQILKLKPDLILLDVNMPKIDGYKLCSLLRNNPALKNVPIIMVTGNTGIIDRAKAKIAGSTDYLTKPFTQEGLLKMVFKHLS
ncbi:response regulator containing a CheY-like receiver domain and a GGDEF domain [Synechococcus sp. PCC 7502]|uniref:response regulator n=1 Tax=Synechococcus sp. PCC 7502 TaxID=1173263 RepID=UPI00029F8C5E|nr:response regulator [Synechococcus sp. PCC 7502]AFY73072.1 response regulator containing a CheY-like receiver domain and a GGDEF domain [Synechococcus sp. PCC 7502]